MASKLCDASKTAAVRLPMRALLFETLLRELVLFYDALAARPCACGRASVSTVRGLVLLEPIPVGIALVRVLLPPCRTDAVRSCVALSTLAAQPPRELPLRPESVCHGCRCFNIHRWFFSTVSHYEHPVRVVTRTFRTPREREA